MRLRLSITLALMVLGGSLRPAPGADSGADPPAGFDPAQAILYGSEHGRLFPTFADLDGDGKTDLLVGAVDWESRHGGRLLVYRNQGTNARPAYAEPAWLDETVPSARIPDG
jgi:FG-GAP repeat protein